ncbi:MAG: nucleotidyltransferase domain-containing protein [Nanoarchaeota archaeon]|nr:nucleotidyltransferase domain-containing protein [Nanoarchaeota archaeon]MBU1103229.1 nucleotidyltransferase domain-containing protein [Nanoarchaeota archaeon]
MITNKQLKIVDVLNKTPGAALTFSEVGKRTNIKSHSFLQRALAQFEKEEIIKSKKSGVSVFYELDFSPKTILYISLAGYEFYKIPAKVTEHLIQEISKETLFFSMVVFGSYAKNEQKKNSDLDVCVIVEDKKITNKVKSRMENVKRREIIGVHSYVFFVKEFEAMLNSEKENVGKEIARNHLPIYNPHSFYRVVEKWNRK